MMGNGRSHDAAKEAQQAQTRLAVAAMLVPLFFVVMFAACIIGTYHRPDPNGIKVGVVGPAALTAPLRAGLVKAVGGQFVISTVPTVAQATDAVQQRELDAAFVPTTDSKEPASIIVAGAGGRLVATAAETLARSVTALQGVQLVVNDVRPLAPGDEIGLGVFLFVIVCTIGGYLAVTVLAAAAPDLLARRRYLFIVAFAILVPTSVYLIAGLGFGTYAGRPGAILAFIAVGALYVFVIGLVTRLLQELIGPVAILGSLTIFVFLNIPSLGATYTANLLPSFWRFFNHYWIGGETVNAERSILYFGGAGVAPDLLRFLAWTGAIVALLLLLFLPRVLKARAASQRVATSAPSSGLLEEVPTSSISGIGPAGHQLSDGIPDGSLRIWGSNEL
jgi:hypothetical protein